MEYALIKAFLYLKHESILKTKYFYADKYAGDPTWDVFL